MRKIAIITGARSEYGILKSLIEAIKKNPKLKLQLIVGGMHLSSEFGYTLNDIEKDGYPIAAKFDMLLSGDTGARMAQSIGVGIIELTQIFELLKPDIVVVHGDREEPFAAAIAALSLHIPICHLAGGEVSTGHYINEAIRFAITKFSHIHFASSKQSAQRIIKLGEETWRVSTTGSAALDTILKTSLLTKSEVAKKFKINLSQPLLLVIQHPLDGMHLSAQKQIRATLKAILELQYPTVLIYPNADPNGRKMIEEIKKHEHLPFLRTYQNLEFHDYLSLAKHASVMIGNSSAGIIETTSLKIPAVNIGNRQSGRERAGNVIDVNYDTKEIVHAIKKAISDKKFQKKINTIKSPYGDGTAAEKMVSILSTIKINEKLLHKKMTY